MKECDCGAATEGKWAGVHHPNCASLQRELICNGDGGEGERLWGLSAGHVLTADDVQDIKNMISNYNDEIGEGAELFHRAYQRALAMSAPDKKDLVEKIDNLEIEVATQRALVSFYSKTRD